MTQVEPFLHPHQIHFLKNQIDKLIGNFYFAGDYRVLAATRDSLQQELENMLMPQTKKQLELIRGASKVRDKAELKLYMAQVEPYVIPFPTITLEEIKKLFPKVKKLELPNLSTVDFRELTYLGWRDISTNRLYLVHQQDGKFVGTVCQYVVGARGVGHCSWCNESHPGSGVGLVTARAKKRHPDDYKTSGTYICLDSTVCNKSLTSTESFEKFFTQLSN